MDGGQATETGPGKIQISLRAPSSMIDAFDRIAEALDRDRSWVLLRALQRYLDTEAAEVLTDEGAGALDRGEGVDFDDVMAGAARILAKVETERACRAG
jgi:predicted transcriptional regulator